MVMAARRIWVGATLLAVACAEEVPPPASPLPPSDEAFVCSQMRRELDAFLVSEVKKRPCGPDLTGMAELVPLDKRRLLVRRRFSRRDEVWTLNADGTVTNPEPIVAYQVDDAEITSQYAAFVPLPASAATLDAPRMMVYQPNGTTWRIYTFESGAPPDETTRTVLDIWQSRLSWPPTAVAPGWKNSNPAVPEPWDRQFLGLEDGYILDRDPGNGSFRIWRLVTVNNQSSLQGPTAMQGGPREAFRRGHRLVRLGPGRLLEWAPHACSRHPALPPAVCQGASYRIWSYRLDDQATAAHDPFVLAHEGVWADIGADNDILVVDSEADTEPDLLVLWSGRTGELRPFGLDLGAENPLDPVHALPVTAFQSDKLKTQPFEPPTTEPKIRRLVLIVQDGRSFDAYFGRYCTAAAGSAPTCDSGRECCEGVPADIPGVQNGCGLLTDADVHKPNEAPGCMRAKMGMKMEGFATALTATGAPCGNAKDVACAPATPPDGDAIGLYHDFARQGAMADRFFQTYAFTDHPLLEPDPYLTNFLYLIAARFVQPLEQAVLAGKPLLTKELLRNQISWAVYAGVENRRAFERAGLALFYDPTWSSYRSLIDESASVDSELFHDLRTGQLPVVSIVVPDRNDPDRSEAPGLPEGFGAGIAFTDEVVRAVGSSLHAQETLILVVHLTAGGFYDHVRPPEAPQPDVDATSGDPLTAKAVHYGPRVPFLALGPFANAGHVSHDELELSSINVFVERNWLAGQPLKGTAELQDRRRYRDARAGNLCSLLRPGLACPP
jgi:hypothetical protein